MKNLQLAGIARAMFANRRAWVFGAAMAMAGAANAAAVEIQVWHTLTDANKAEFEKLAKQYNKEQDQVRVTLRGFASAARWNKRPFPPSRPRRARTCCN